MTLYVAGFLFAGRPAHSVLLVRKLKGPPIVVGKWNGIGGKVEPGEWPADAMVREMREEANIDSRKVGLAWDQYATLDFGHAQVRFFKAFADKMPRWKRMEAEPIQDVPINQILHLHQKPAVMTVHNLPWLIHLALDPDVTHAKVEGKL